MTRDQFYGVAELIRTLWTAESFHKSWNPDNQEVGFKLFSYFPVEDVKEAFKVHRFESPDSVAPKFKTVSDYLWDRRRDAKAAIPAATLPGSVFIREWGARKSDGDLIHLWFQVQQQYAGLMDVHDRLWKLISADEIDPRCEARLTLSWAAENNISLTFKRGTDEWLSIMGEYDAQQREKMVKEYRGKRSPLKPRTGESVQAVAALLGDLHGEPQAPPDEITA